MRRVSEWIYFIAFIGNGIWAVVMGIMTVFSGFSDLETMGTWSSWLMIGIMLTLKMIGSIENTYTKTHIFLFITALLGGMWGLGTILVLMSGMMMLSTAFKQYKVIKSLPSYREVRAIRKKQLEDVEDEEVKDVRDEGEEESKVPLELLEGYRGQEEYEIKAKTWINTAELNKEQLTERELRAIAKNERRENRITLETLVELEALEQEEEEQDLTNIDLDFATSSEPEVEDTGSITTKDTKVEGRDGSNKTEDGKKSFLDMSLEDFIGG